ncbi:hypothetical protein D0B32_15370 [Paraburkholderia sp. DHOC27]|nr:hypothetical protein D0B32_15370 [Paraburkholderia sp. DHOC27]
MQAFGTAPQDGRFRFDDARAWSGRAVAGQSGSQSSSEASSQAGIEPDHCVGRRDPAMDIFRSAVSPVGRRGDALSHRQET